MVACTRSGHEVIVVSGNEQAVVPVHRVVPVDATGAGDQFAAGFLYGIATGQSLATCGHMGCVAAAGVISPHGAPGETDLRGAVPERGVSSEVAGGAAPRFAPRDICEQMDGEGGVRPPQCRHVLAARAGLKTGPFRSGGAPYSSVHKYPREG